MTNKQRVISALNFETMDLLPFSISLTAQARQNVIDYTGDKDYIKHFNDHITYQEVGKPQKAIKPDYDIDEFSVIWNKSGADKDIGVIDNIQILDWDSFNRYEFPPIDEDYIHSVMTKLEQSDNDNFKVAAMGFSLFERVWTLMGFEDTLCNMLAEPELVHALFDRVCERNLKILDIALEHDFDCFHFGDDWGQQKGLIMGLPHWNEFVKPRLKRMYDRVKRSNRYISQHSCGDISQLLDTLHDMGLNIYQTFQPEIYDLDYAKKLKGRIVVWGGISTQVDLPVISKGEVKPLVMRTIQAFDNTGIILCPTHAIEVDVKAENIVALMEAFTHQS